MRQPSVGVLPLYVELYDNFLPERRTAIEGFLPELTAALETRGVDVTVAPVCRVESEFRAGVAQLEAAGVDLLVTLHLAYSPSEESAAVLAGTPLPLLVLDTTPTYDFGPRQEPAALMANHGIHGVQDMCNLLIRNGKSFAIEAGHWAHSDVLDRVASWARAARLAASLRAARVGRVGAAFRGMGDFAVPPDVLRAALGMETVAVTPADVATYLPAADAPEVEAEMRRYVEEYDAGGVEAEALRRTARACLALRGWLEHERLTAFSMNFLAFDAASGLPTIPFLEASRAMGRGLGYAGEGDVLTAGLVGALASVYPETSFTEMFCPDWAGNTIFLSHMGEMNLALAAGRPRLLEKPFPWTDIDNPAVAVGRFKAGEAVFVDLAPLGGDRFRLLLAPVRMAEVTGEDAFAEVVRGWFAPRMPVADFLAEYSRLGGTHHAALVYGEVTGDLAKFGRIMGWDVKVIGD